MTPEQQIRSALGLPEDATVEQVLERISLINSDGNDMYCAIIRLGGIHSGWQNAVESIQRRLDGLATSEERVRALEAREKVLVEALEKLRVVVDLPPNVWPEQIICAVIALRANVHNMKVSLGVPSNADPVECAEFARRAAEALAAQARICGRCGIVHQCSTCWGVK